jgi:hypothetical protein
MAIKKAVKTNPDEFIAGAPDAAALTPQEPPVKGVMRGHKRQITLTLSPALLPQIDAAAAALGISRAAWVSMTLSQGLRK